MVAQSGGHGAGAPCGSPLFWGAVGLACKVLGGQFGMAGVGDDPYGVLVFRTEGAEVNMSP